MSSAEVADTISGLITVLEGPVKAFESARNDIQLSEEFEIVGRRLPVLGHILQTYKSNLELYKSSLLPDSWQALEITLEDCDEKARKLAKTFEKVISGPGDLTEWRKRYTKLISLRVNKEAAVSAGPSQNEQLENILKEIQSLKISTVEDAKRSVQNFHGDGAQMNVNTVSRQINSGSGQQINNNGPVRTQNFSSVNTIEKDYFGFRRPISIFMGQAPCMSANYFVGRDPELAEIPKLLHPDPQTQRLLQKQQQRLALAGTGGIGKTQIAIAYAQTPSESYQSVLWMNATSEATLKSSFESVAGSIFSGQVSRPLDESEIITRTLHWLCDPNNTKWLLIFDNYDDRDQFKLEKYYPPVAHGAIIVTTRRPDVVIGTSAVLEIKPLSDSNGLEILQIRSQRENLQSDTGAKRLAERLAGLPLALATAGAFLRQRTWSFERYLEEYEAKWNVDPRRPIKLQEYHERTLWTTWNISYDRLEMNDLEAARMLKLLAYFGNESLWHDYFCAGLNDNSPLHEVIGDENNFLGVMEVLSDYSFLEFHPNLGTWSMHNCVHDWTLAALNENINTEFYWYAVECAASSVREKLVSDRSPYNAGIYESLAFARFIPHAVQLRQQRFVQSDIFANPVTKQMEFLLDISNLLEAHMQSVAASTLLLPAISQSQRVLGPDHKLTLQLMSNIGWSYHRQSRCNEAREFLSRAMAKQEEHLGLYNSSTLTTVIRLGAAYLSQGELDGATQIMSRALAGARAPDSDWSAGDWEIHFHLLEIHSNLALVLIGRDKYCDAERILNDVIKKRQELHGQTHLSTLRALSNLGLVYQKQTKLKDAERIYRLVLDSMDKIYSPVHSLTLVCVASLGTVLLGQKRFKEAENCIHRALAGYEEAFGPHHEQTIALARHFGDVYCDRGYFHDAEQMYNRALTWKERVLGPDDKMTLEIVDALAYLYSKKGQMDDAEQMFLRALRGNELLGIERISGTRSVSDIALDLGAIYLQKMQIEKAEGMFEKALKGLRKDKDSNDEKIRTVAALLWSMHRMQGDLTKEEMMGTLAGHVMGSLQNKS